MQTLHFMLAMLLLLTLGAGLWRAVRGPTAADRMLAVQVFGTTAVTITLLLSQAFGDATLRDVAVMIAVLAAVTAVAFVQRAWLE